MEAAVTLRSVSAFYDGKPALEQISLSFSRNRITAVLGPSGCGKSTLLRAVNRMLEEEAMFAMLPVPLWVVLQKLLLMAPQ